MSELVTDYTDNMILSHKQALPSLVGIHKCSPLTASANFILHISLFTSHAQYRVGNASCVQPKVTLLLAYKHCMSPIFLHSIALEMH